MSARAAVLIFIFIFVACTVQGAMPVNGSQNTASRPTVYAWFPAQFGSWKTDGIDWECLTHLCFRSVELEADGKVRRVSGNPPRDFVEPAHRHGVKVTVLVWTRSRSDSDGYLARFHARLPKGLQTSL